MNRYFKLLLIFLPVLVFAKSYKIEKGDVVYVTSCNKHNWCKVENQDLYIKSVHYYSAGKEYILRSEQKTFFYTKTTNGSNNKYKKVNEVPLNIHNSFINECNFITRANNITINFSV